MKAETESWVQFVETDYIQVLNNFSGRFVPDGVCYHSQQCVEKYLKALLEENDRPIPKTHDLGNLLDRVKDVLPELGTLTAEIVRLSNLLVVLRYPTAEVLLSDLAAEAESSDNTMRSVRKIVRAKLGLPEDHAA